MQMAVWKQVLERPWALRRPWDTKSPRTLRALELMCPAVGTEQGLGAGRELVPFSTSVWNQRPL